MGKYRILDENMWGLKGYCIESTFLHESDLPGHI